MKYHEDPTVIERLETHNRMLEEADKFIDFISHVDKQARLALRSNK
jgi:hypothetical protein